MVSLHITINKIFILISLFFLHWLLKTTFLVPVFGLVWLETWRCNMEESFTYYTFEYHIEISSPLHLNVNLTHCL